MVGLKESQAKKLASTLLPKKCPHCFTSTKWTCNDKGKKIDLYCPNTKCPGPHLRQLHHFFTVLKVDGLSEGILKHMVVAGLDSVPKILAADKKQLSKVAGFADKKISNTLMGLTKLVKDMSLVKLAHASGLFATETTGIGTTLLKPMIAHIGQKQMLSGAFDPHEMQLKLLELHGIGGERAKLFVDKLPEFREFYRSLTNVSLAKEVTGGKLAGKVFCFSGFRDQDLHDKIEKLGGRVASSVTKQVGILFTGDMSSTKTTKARQMGITIVAEAEAKAYVDSL